MTSQLLALAYKESMFSLFLCKWSRTETAGERVRLCFYTILLLLNCLHHFILVSEVNEVQRKGWQENGHHRKPLCLRTFWHFISGTPFTTFIDFVPALFRSKRIMQPAFVCVCAVCYLNSVHLCRWHHRVQSRESPEAEYLNTEGWWDGV